MKKVGDTKETQKKDNVFHKKEQLEQFERLNCSAGGNGSGFSCYDSASIKKLKELWNKRHPDNPIHETNDREIWSSLRRQMSDVCNTEKCWMRQQFAKNKLSPTLISYTFAPTAPTAWIKNNNEWLSSVDIQKVMQQYERKYSHFEFIGPSPIDFDKKLVDGECVWNELCNFQVSDTLARNKTKIGFIFNTDPHYLRGSHWIALFVDLRNKLIIYFDSTGDAVPKEIKKLIARIKGQAKDLGINMETMTNKKQHQKGETECGMYCLHFIIGLLAGKHKPEYYLKSDISDDDMEKLRAIYFNRPGL